MVKHKALKINKNLQKMAIMTLIKCLIVLNITVQRRENNNQASQAFLALMGNVDAKFRYISGDDSRGYIGPWAHYPVTKMYESQRAHNDVRRQLLLPDFYQQGIYPALTKAAKEIMDKERRAQAIVIYSFGCGDGQDMPAALKADGAYRVMDCKNTPST